MNIALFGGSFDPPHIGHLLIAQQVKEILSLDQVWFLPAVHHPFQRNLNPFETRLAMTKTFENEWLKVSDFEKIHNPSSYTIETLQAIEKEYPEHTFYWVMGSDQLANFQKYKNWQEIIKKHNVIIFPREWILPEFEERVKEAFLLKTIPQNVMVLHTKNLVLTNISSTKIRERVKHNLSIDLLVTKAIEVYINKKNLYR